MQEHGGSNRTGSASRPAVIHPENQCNDSIVEHLVTKGTNLTFQLELETAGLKFPTSNLSFLFKILNYELTGGWHRFMFTAETAGGRRREPRTAWWVISFTANGWRNAGTYESRLQLRLRWCIDMRPRGMG